MRATSALLLLALSGLALAADTAPEVARDPAPPQAVGKPHTLRTIPEACARLTGEFTGDPARPYAFGAVRSSPNCQPRARLVDAAKVGASAEAGWILNDLVAGLSAPCPGPPAVVEVWLQDTTQAAPELDGQGQARIYLREGIARAKAGKLAALPVYAAAISIQGDACN